MKKAVMFLVALSVFIGIASSTALSSEASGDKVRGDEGQGETELNCLHEGIDGLESGCVYEVRP